MDSSVPRSTLPVALTVASEAEPIECDGIYTETADGFTLEFSIREDDFIIEHNGASSRIAAKGLMSYEIILGVPGATTLLATPYGKVRFDVETINRDVVRQGDGLRVLFRYALFSEPAGRIDRAVDIAARFTHNCK